MSTKNKTQPEEATMVPKDGKDCLLFWPNFVMQRIFVSIHIGTNTHPLK